MEIKPSSLPFDLKPLFSLNHLNTSFDTLKKAIEYLADQQKKMNDKIAVIDKQTQQMAELGLETPLNSGRGTPHE